MTNKGRIERNFNQEVSSDVTKALDLISKGFYLTNNNTTLEHTEGGFVTLSKRVSNHFNKK